MKSCFLLRGRPKVARGWPVDGRRPGSLQFYRAKCDGQIACIFTVHAGTFAHNPLQKCSRSVLRTAKPFPKDSAARHEVQRAPWVLARAPEKVSLIRCGHQDGHQLESLHFYGVPWPHRRRQKSFKKVVVKLTTFFKKAVCKIQIDRRLESLHVEG